MKILSIAKSFILLALISCHVQIWASCSISTEPIHGIDSSKPYALVAGGSTGIGFAIAEALASRNYNLILIARHEGPLVQAKNKLESLYGIHVEILMKDLSVESSASEIAAWCTERHIRLKMLCNVAGMGGVQDYLSIPLDTVQYMVRLNVESCMALSLTLLPLLEQNSPSYILNIASMAAFAPIPQKNVYAATKSAVLFFSYALRYQLKKKILASAAYVLDLYSQSLPSKKILKRNLAS